MVQVSPVTGDVFFVLVENGVVRMSPQYSVSASLNGARVRAC